MNEYEILYYIRQNNEEASKMLINSFQKRIYCAIRRIKDKLNYRYTTSDEDEELIHYCNQALLKAVERYQDYGKASFTSYATSCIEKAIRTYIRNKRTGANRELSNALPLDAVMSEKEGLYYIDVVENNNPAFNPADSIHKIEQEMMKDFLKSKLSDIEYQVYELRLLGYNNREIAEKMNETPRRINYIYAKIKKLLISHID